MADTETAPTQTAAPEDYAAFERWRQDTPSEGEKTPESQPAGEGGEPEAKTDSEPGAEKKQEPDTERPKKDRIQKRFDQLTREKYELMARIEALEQRLAQGDKTSPVAKQPEGAPRPEDYESYEDYVEARAVWRVQQELANRERQAAELAAQRQAQEMTSRWAARVDAAREKYEDFDDVLDSDTPITAAMQQAIMESDAGADIAYYLGKHPDEAARIAALSPVAAVREIGKIEAKLTSSPERTPKVSTAPPPAKTLKGGSAAVDLNNPKLPYEEWERLRTAQLRKR